MWAISMATTYPAQGAQTGYSRVAIGLHWGIAALLAANLILGFWHNSFGKQTSAWLMFFHESIGVSVVGLTLVRLAWRLSHRPPALDEVVKAWEAKLARTVHASFYVLLLLLPLTGLSYASSWGRAIPFFGLLEISPLPVPTSSTARALFGNVHEVLAFVTIGLILLHVTGALKHHLQGHAHLIRRMSPWGSPTR